MLITWATEPDRPQVGAQRIFVPQEPRCLCLSESTAPQRQEK